MKTSLIILCLFFTFFMYAQDKEENWDFVISSVDETISDDKNKEKNVSKADKDKLKEKIKEETNEDPKAEMNTEGDDASMDFSGFKLESDDLDEEEEELEEKEIDAEIASDEKKIKRLNLKEIKRKEEAKKKEKHRFISFLKLNMQIDYQNLMLFDRIPYQHSLGIEASTLIMGLELKRFNVYLGELGYRFLSTTVTPVHSLLLSPIRGSFSIQKYGHTFPITVNVFRVYFFNKLIGKTAYGDKVDLYMEYLDVRFGWQFFKDLDFTSTVFIGLSYAQDNTKNTFGGSAIAFRIGIAIDFMPLNISF